MGPSCKLGAQEEDEGPAQTPEFQWKEAKIPLEAGAG